MPGSCTAAGTTRRPPWRPRSSARARFGITPRSASGRSRSHVAPSRPRTTTFPDRSPAIGGAVYRRPSPPTGTPYCDIRCKYGRQVGRSSSSQASLDWWTAFGGPNERSPCGTGDTQPGARRRVGPHARGRPPPRGHRVGSRVGGRRRVELLLDIAAREADGGSAERHTLTVDCTIADLERMLESSSDTVRVGFDAEALARAIREPDIGGARAAREDGRAGHRRRDDRLGRRRRRRRCRPRSQGGGTGTTITDVRDMPGDSMIASQSLGEPCGPDGVSGHHLRGAGRSAERRNRRSRFGCRHAVGFGCGFAVGCSGA